MVMLDFICMDSAELFGTGGTEKFKMKIYISSGIRALARDSLIGKLALRPLGHTGQISSGGFIVLQYSDLWIKMDMWQYMFDTVYASIANAMFFKQ